MFTREASLLLFWAVKHIHGLALSGGLIAVFFLGERRMRSEHEIAMHGWTMTQFIEHLDQKGLHLHVVPSAQDGRLDSGAYLTEDASSNWSSMQPKMRVAQQIAHWQGIVHVAPIQNWNRFDIEEVLGDWGDCGCRIGDFLLFGEPRLLRQMQDACRP